VKRISITDPSRVSAPLPDDFPIDIPNEHDLVAEITRAYAELRWALHRQRTTWAHMAKVREEYKEKGNAYFYENERRWKLATGDVQWWRGEVNSRSNALTALLSLAAAMGIDIST
jgi:hypothetical protein